LRLIFSKHILILIALTLLITGVERFVLSYRESSYKKDPTTSEIMLSFFDEYGIHNTAFTDGPERSRGTRQYFNILTDCSNRECVLGHHVASANRIAELVDLCELLLESSILPKTKLVVFAPASYHPLISNALENCLVFEIRDTAKI
jgi:hypothetical protein